MTIARNLVLNVIAEGIENMDQLAFYQNLGCFHIQGSSLSNALPAQELATLLCDGIKPIEDTLIIAACTLALLYGMFTPVCDTSRYFH